MKLFTVGPVACRPEILAEMGRQMYSHRSEEYKVIHKQTVERLGKFLETKNQIFLFPGSGSGVMEGTVRNCVDKKMLCCINGEFGKRYAEVGISNGKEVERLESTLGSPTTPEDLEAKLSASPDVEAVTITYNETSVGLINPLPELARVAKEHGKLVFVDAVSAMGGAEIKVDQWGLDVCFTSSQKCFGVPPGLAMASISEAALKKSESAKNKGWYFDFKLYEKYQQKEWGTHMTPPVPQIAALNKELGIIEQEGGKTKRLELYAKRSKMVKEGVENLGLSLYPKPGCESPTVACVNAPKSTSGLDVYKKMRLKGIELAKGYGSLKDSTFRIGNMGYIRIEDINEMLQSLSEVLK
jgi:aspartate aminotransferase-like enzyme